MSPSVVTRRGSLRPSWACTQISYSPLASDSQATWVPSGDQLTLCSRASGVRLRLRGSPSLAGTVNTSPRAPNTARSPAGERPNDSTKSPALTKRGWVSGASPVTRIGTSRASRVAGSKRQRPPPFSNTMASVPALGQSTS